MANGQSIPNEGERWCMMMTRGAPGPKRITFQVAEVHKALLSITRAADVGYECLLNLKGGLLIGYLERRKGSKCPKRQLVRNVGLGER